MMTRELQQKIISNMKQWQKIEDDIVASTGQTIQKTDNIIIRLIMDIILRDSQMHYWVQEWIADSLEHKTVTLSPKEMDKVWELLEQHIELEKESVEIAKQTLASLKGGERVIQQSFLNYLLEDEQKHSNLLSYLENVKRGMYP